MIRRILRLPYRLFKKLNKNMFLLTKKLFFKIDKNHLRKKFLELGLKENMNIYVHSSLSKFGYVEGGADSVLTVLQDIIQDGTIMMPTFTYFKKEFSLNNPCWTGKLAENFRLQENTKRSVHPTHSVAVKGKHVNIFKGHEKSKAPFDKNSPYEKFTKLDSYILMLGTENNSMIHYSQDKVNFPDLFLEGSYEYIFNKKKYKTRLHHPKGSITYVYNGRPCSDVYFLVKMYKDLNFHKKGIMKTVKIGNAICHLIKTKEFVNESIRYLKENIKKYEKEYKTRLK